MEDRRESTSVAARTGFERIGVPIIRVFAWGAVSCVFLATFVLLAGDGTGQAARVSAALFRNGLLSFAFLFGLSGLFVLPMKEKLALFGVLLLAAWLTA
ncbi:MAG: hypothetical protein NUW08_02535 [Candidatus Uhrbacteria bacterium]|nr:hypothetical protein [Candidatus Uhrbacteria bacterium]